MKGVLGLFPSFTVRGFTVMWFGVESATAWGVVDLRDDDSWASLLFSWGVLLGPVFIGRRR